MSEPSDAIKSVSPPKARLTFRIGVVGHRPNRLKREEIPSLAARLAGALLSVKKIVEEFSANHAGLFAAGAPRLRAVSPLAEGTDRYFAEEAVRLGYELCCPLPFHKEEFENDFKPGKSLETGADSVAEFNRILGEARSKSGLVVFELDGARSEASEAYAAAGRVVLNQSDLLIVVWDGGSENQRGGTYETLKEALAFHVPVLWIDARAPHPWQLLEQETDLPLCGGGRCVPRNEETPEISRIVNRVLQPPETPATKEERHDAPDLRVEYFSERAPAGNWGFFWKVFRDLVGSFRFRIPEMRARHFDEAPAGDWSRDAPGVAGWVNARLAAHYAWSDTLADFYADKYRTSFVLCYLLGALAVMFALLPGLFGDSLTRFSVGVEICSGGELFAVAMILLLVGRGNRCRWHDRWMAYRLVAELVRQLRFLIPLGGGRPFPRLAQHLGHYGNPAESWMYWHLRAIDRDVGLPETKVTAESLKDCLNYVAQVVRSQIEFHRAAMERSQRIHHRLHFLCLFLFGLTFAMVFAHFASYWVPTAAAQPFRHWVGWMFFGGFLPAAGAALAAINNQGEFARISKRSHAMAERLEQMNGDLKQLLEPAAAVRSSEAAGYALRLAQTMVDEVLDWRVVFLDRPLTPA